MISGVLIAIRVCCAWMFRFAHSDFNCRKSFGQFCVLRICPGQWEDLLALIRSGDPEMRLKLKAEIGKRVSRIEISFGLDGFQAVADVKFINGVQRGIILDGERALFLR